jgi:hypothetical protein
MLVKKDLLNKNTLLSLAFADVGFLGGLISTAYRKRNIASSIDNLCREDDTEAMSYAPNTMGNLCHYHWMLEWTVSFCVVLTLVSLANFFWSVFGVVVGIPADFEKMTESREDMRQSQMFGRGMSRDIPPLSVPAQSAGPRSQSPFDDSDIHVDVR